MNFFSHRHSQKSLILLATWFTFVLTANAQQQSVPQSVGADAFQANLEVTPYLTNGWSGTGTLKGGVVRMQLTGQTATQASYSGSISSWSWTGTFQTPIGQQVVHRTETGAASSTGISLVWNLTTNQYKLIFGFPYQWQNKFPDGHVEGGSWSYLGLGVPFELDGNVTTSGGRVLFSTATRFYGQSPDVMFGNATEKMTTSVELSSCLTPLINTQPQSKTIIGGQSATLSVTATSSAPITYQWYAGTSGNTSAPITGATASTFATPPLTNTATYWVRVSNNCGSVNSSTATITVQPDINLPVQRWSQGDPTWATDTYDHHPGTTIRQNGCALTTLAMALRFAGVTTLPNNTGLNPRTLNDFMNSQPAASNAYYNENHDVIFSNTARDASGNITWNNLNANSTAHDVIEVLKQGYPVIVRVTNSKGGGHYVLITGVQPDGVFRIQDPGRATRTTLTSYGNQFSARGYIAPAPPVQLPLKKSDAVSGVKGLASQSADQSALNFGVGDAVNILVTDQAGRRTGIDPNTGQVLQEIPNSFYYSDGLSDDDDEGPTTQTDHAINISNPGQGVYTVTLSGRRAGEYQLRTGIYSQDGTAQPPLLATGQTTTGSSSSHQVTFTPNATPTLFTEEGSPRAAALDSVTLLRDPFQVVATHNLSADPRTRVTLFASNANLSPTEPISVVTAVAKDAQNNTYPLEVEYVGQAPKYRWLSQIVVKLPGDISSGDVLISIKVRGVQSNEVLIRIKSPGN